MVFGCDEGSSVGMCMQDYKSLCAVVTMCATLVSIQAHTETEVAFSSAAS